MNIRHMQIYRSGWLQADVFMYIYKLEEHMFIIDKY